MTASIDPLLSWVLDALAPLRHAIASPQRFGLLLRDLGWDVEVADELMAGDGPLADILADLGDVLDEADDVRAALAGLGDSDEAPVETLVQIGELARAAMDLVASLSSAAGDVESIRDEVDPLFLEPTFWADLAADLPAYLFVRALRRLNPAAEALLTVFGVVESEAVGTGTRATVRQTLRWDRVGDLITRPHELLAETFGWGRALDQVHLRDSVIDLAVAGGLRVELASPDADLYGSLGLFADEDAASAAQQVSSALVSGVIAGAGWVELGLRLVPVPSSPSAADLTGVYLGGYAIGQLATSMALSPTWRVELGAGTEGALGGVHLDPSLPAPVFVPAAGEAALSLSLIGEPARPWKLISLGSAPSLSAERVELTLAASTSELTVEAGVDLALTLAPTDGFLRSILGDAPEAVTASPRLGWSSTRGVYVAGGVGFSVTIPLSLSLGPVLIDELALALEAGADGLALEARVSGGLVLGPLTFVVEGVGLSAALAPSDDAATGGVTTTIRFLPPHGLGLALDLGELGGGGGYLECHPDEGRYDGVADVDLLGVGVTAIGVLTTEMPDGSDGWSLFLSLSATFTGLQLGFGFTLLGVGGLIGINRAVDLDALSDGVRSGALEGLLFPDDPVADAARILADIDAIFPPAEGQYVIGPMAKIGWGTPTLASVDLGIILQLPDPLTISLLGSFEAVLPTADVPVLELRIDVAGTLDLTGGTLAIDASLRDSRVAGLTLSGDVAIRAAFTGQPSFLMSFGGFNPRFVPPAGFPALDRLSVALDGGDNLRIELGGYFAITSNTVQFGSRCDLWAKAVGLTVEGGFSFDALLQFSPFWFVIDLGFDVSVSAGNTELFGVHLDFMLEGPKPWHAVGTATVKVLGIKKDFHVEATLGGAEPDVTRESIDVRALLIEALADPDAWSAVLPAADARAVTLGDDGGDAELRAHPAGVLEVRQRVAPLERDLEHYGNATVSGLDRFELTDAALGGAPAAVVETIDDWFAPAQYFELGATEKLSAPSFEEMPCGLRLGDDSAEGGPASDFELGYEQIVRDPDLTDDDRRLDLVHRPEMATLTAAVGRSPVARARRARGMATSASVAAAAAPAFALAEVRYVVADADTGAVDGDATPVGGVSWSVARSAWRAGEGPRQVVPAYEHEEDAA